MSQSFSIEGSGSGSGKIRLKDFPGEEPYRHAGKAWIEGAQSVLASHNLLTVANGKNHPDAIKIVDTPETDFLNVPADHHDYYRIHEAKMRARRQNLANTHTRFAINSKAWNEIYSAISLASEKNAPVFNRHLKELCDLQKIHNDPRFDGLYDGPLAWRLIKAKALPPADQRTKQDKEFYDTSRNLQKQNRLPDHCPASAYQKKALAFLVNINPYLAQPYAARDAAEYLMDLVPSILEPQLYMLKTTLLPKFASSSPPDLMDVIKECSKLVFESQKGSSTPNIATMSIDLPFDKVSLAATTGMELQSAFAMNGTKFCEQCDPDGSHKGKPCWSSPSFTGPLPVPVYCNRRRRAEIEQARAANAKKFGTSLAPLQSPTAERIKAYEARQRDKDKGKSKDKGSSNNAIDEQTLDNLPRIEDAGLMMFSPDDLRRPPEDMPDITQYDETPSGSHFPVITHPSVTSLNYFQPTPTRDLPGPEAKSLETLLRRHFPQGPSPRRQIV